MAHPLRAEKRRCPAGPAHRCLSEGAHSSCSGDVSLVASDTANGCGGLIDDYLQGTFPRCPRCEMADSLASPSGGLRSVLNEVARSLGNRVFGPLFEDTLREARPHIGPDATQGVVLFVGADGRLNSVHEPPFIIPQPQAVLHAQ